MDCTNSDCEIKRIPNHVFESAMGWLRAGVSVVPMKLDGTKSTKDAWKLFQQRLPTADEVRDWFSRPAGIGAVCGVVSGGLECIDFDDGSLFEPWRRMVEDIVCRLPVVETGGGGYHVVYRCSVICGNHKIAIDPEREDKKTLIETRGEGGLFVAVGSPLAVHSSGDPYIQVAGPFLPEGIPIITEAERLRLWQAARSFDRAGELQRIINEQSSKLQPPRQATGNEPWHRFDAKADWDSLLRGAGWKSRNGEHWTRPGKEFGTSATLRQTTSGDVVLCVFSSNAGISLNGGHRTLSPSAFVAETRFGGDWKAAARYFREEVSV